jgi:hypothetical protein
MILRLVQSRVKRVVATSVICDFCLQFIMFFVAVLYSISFKYLFIFMLLEKNEENTIKTSYL